MSRVAALVFFLALTVGGGLAIGYVTLPGAWYAGLTKPGFTPPNWVFAPVWTALYVLIAVAGWRVWERDRASAAMRLWWTQLALNFLWSPVFFGAQRIGLGVVVIVALLGVVVAFVASAWRIDRVAALLFLPYAAWVAFASALNVAIWRLNG